MVTETINNIGREAVGGKGDQCCLSDVIAIGKCTNERVGHQYHTRSLMSHWL